MRWIAILAFGVLCVASAANAQPSYPASFRAYAGERNEQETPANVAPPQLKDVTFKQRLNEKLPFDATFRDEQGRTVKLGA